MSGSIAFWKAAHRDPGEVDPAPGGQTDVLPSYLDSSKLSRFDCDARGGMKRLSQIQQFRLWNAGRRRWRRSVARRGKTHQRVKRITITPPPILSFSQNFQATIYFLEEFRRATLHVEHGEKPSNVFVDLVPVRQLSVPVAIVLAAEFHRWSIVRRTKLQPRNSTKWDPAVRNLLSDLGVFDLLGSRPVTWGDGPIDNLTLSPLESGLKFDGDKIDDLQAHFSEILNGFTKNPKVFDGLMEAAENAISHAYPTDFEPRHPFAGHRWWGASCLDIAGKRIRFFIFDQGAGIPFTLPKGALWEHIVAFLAERSGGLISDDAVMLKAAFEAGRTSTGMDNRGLGLKRMADVVRGSDSGFLRIISGKAEIVHWANDDIATKGLPTHIGGTLIEWSLPSDVFTETIEDQSHAND